MVKTRAVLWLYLDARQRHRWSFSINGNVVAVSPHGYSRRRAAQRAFDRLQRRLTDVEYMRWEQAR